MALTALAGVTLGLGMLGSLTYPARKPGLVDDIEVIGFLGAVGTVAVLLAAQLVGLTRTP